MGWVADFLATYPRVRLALVLSDSKADLIADRIDVAFRGGPLEDSAYVGRHVFCTGNDGLVASPSYLAARGAPSTLQDLLDHDRVTFTQPGSSDVTWQLAGPDGIEEAVQVAARFSGNTAQALRKATLAGLGITLLPRAVIINDLRAGRLVPVLRCSVRSRVAARRLQVYRFVDAASAAVKRLPGRLPLNDRF